MNFENQTQIIYQAQEFLSAVFRVTNYKETIAIFWRFNLIFCNWSQFIDTTASNQAQ